jgi:hypothetical protein
LPPPELIPPENLNIIPLKVHATTMHEGIRRRVNILGQGPRFFAVVLFSFHTPTIPPPFLRTDDIESVQDVNIFYKVIVALVLPIVDPLCANYIKVNVALVRQSS